MKYLVTVEKENLSGEVSTEEIEVDTKSAGLAAKMAEQMSPASTAVSIRTTQDIVGRCSRCSVFIFEDDPYRTRGGRMLCEVC